MSKPPALTYGDAEALLRELGDASTRVILVGGQALNFWAEYFIRAGQVPALAAGAPFTSKDIDFQGDAAAVEQIATKLKGWGGKALFPENDMSGVNSGKVLYTDPSTGHRRELDFINSVLGCDTKHLIARSIPAAVSSGGAPTARVRVMHPVDCMRSRLANLRLPEKKTPHARQQASASIACVRCFIIEITVDGHVRDALKLIKEVFDLGLRDGVGGYAFRDHDLDLFLAIPTHPTLPARHNTENYGRMEAAMRKRQGSWKRTIEG